MSKKTIAIDFDGVIHSYTSGWRGPTVIPDPPTRGAFEFLTRAISRFRVVIYSTRAATQNEGGRVAILDWLLAHGLEPAIANAIDITAEKPPAIIYLDDRGWQFCGEWPELDAVESFEPYREDDGCSATPNVLAAVLAQCRANDRQWGGPDHDDTHQMGEWNGFMLKQLAGATQDAVQFGDEDFDSLRRRWVNVAALAVQAVRALDRRRA